MNKLYIIAGEASGDLLGSNVMHELYKENPDLDIRFWGGDLMQAEGGEMAKHIRDLAFMGFVEVVANLPTILKNIRYCKEDILRFQPDAILFVDYPGFNLRLAKWAHQQGFKTHFYVSPTVWAWKEKRVYTIRENVDKLYCILPFEKEFYAKFGYDVEYVGHPLVDAINRYREKPADDLSKADDSRPVLALLPGSRKQEISKKLPLMLEAVQPLMNDYRIVIAGAPAIDPDFYRQFLADSVAELHFGKTYDILNVATAGLVTSGTATLEAALFRVPEVVCYVGSAISFAIAKRIVNVKFISLVNLILDRESVKELIQQDASVENMRAELLKILPGGADHNRLLRDYDELIASLGTGGASRKVAISVLKSIEGA